MEPYLIIFKPNCSLQVMDQVIAFIRWSNNSAGLVGTAKIEMSLNNKHVWLINLDNDIAAKLSRNPAIAHVGGVHFRQRNTQIRRLNSEQ